jgi:hypothetical protein
MPAPGYLSEEACDRQADSKHPGVPGHGVGRTGPDLLADPLQAVRTRLDVVGGSAQLMPNELGEVVALGTIRTMGAVAGSYHGSCSSSTRSEAIPRAVWLFTAPRLIPIAAAISASEKSA